MAKGFETLESVPASSTADAVAILDRDGGVVLLDVASKEEVAAIREELAPHFDAAEYGFEEYYGYHTRRIGMLVRHSPTMRKVVVRQGLLDLCAHYLDGPEAFQLHETQGVDIGPGNDAQPLHNDDDHSFRWPPRPRPEFLCVALLAVDPFTVENGATRVIKGSHKWAEGRKPTDTDEIAYATMPEGAVCFIFGSTWHSGGANRSTAHRVGCRFLYSRWWLRQGENMYLATPPAMVKGWDPALRGLLGYKSFNSLGDIWDPAYDDVVVREPMPDFIVEARNRRIAELEAAKRG